MIHDARGCCDNSDEHRDQNNQAQQAKRPQQWQRDSPTCGPADCNAGKLGISCLSARLLIGAWNLDNGEAVSAVQMADRESHCGG
jgi:hypothetical protein